MNITQGTSAHQIRIILTRTVHTIDTVTSFNILLLTSLLEACDRLEDVLMIEKACVSSPIVKELIDVDVETLKENVAVLNSAIELKKFDFEFELNMN